MTGHRCPHCGRPSTSDRTFDLGGGLIHIECPCGIAYTPDLALSDGESPRRYVEIEE